MFKLLMPGLNSRNGFRVAIAPWMASALHMSLWLVSSRPLFDCLSVAVQL
jgi:hypothetical protein